MNQRIETEKKQNEKFETLLISQIIPNPEQPRKHFDEEGIVLLGNGIVTQRAKRTNCCTADRRGYVSVGKW